MNIKTLLCMGSIAVILLAIVAVSCAQPDAQTSTTEPPSPPDSVASEPGVNSEQLDSYMAVAPAVLRSGETESISVSLFVGLEPAPGAVRLQLTQNGNPVAEATEFVRGFSSIGLPVPELLQAFIFLASRARAPVAARFETRSKCAWKMRWMRHRFWCWRPTNPSTSPGNESTFVPCAWTRSSSLRPGQLPSRYWMQKGSRYFGRR